MPTHGKCTSHLGFGLAAQPDTPLAFESPRYTVMQNIEGTVEVLEAVRHAGGVSKILFAGSGNELGRSRYLPMDEEHPLTPHNPYGFSKAAGELAMWAWHRSYEIPAVVLSTGVVIGPGMRREVFIFKWLWNALHGQPIVVEGGRQTRDVLHRRRGGGVGESYPGTGRRRCGAEVLHRIWRGNHREGPGLHVPGTPPEPEFQ